jgi:hypothetical protein
MKRREMIATQHGLQWDCRLAELSRLSSTYLNNLSSEYLPVAGQISQRSLIACQALRNDFQLNDLGRFSRQRKPGIKTVTSKSDAGSMTNLI